MEHRSPVEHLQLLLTLRVVAHYRQRSSQAPPSKGSMLSHPEKKYSHNEMNLETIVRKTISKQLMNE
jgi:hypothetical protein